MIAASLNQQDIIMVSVPALLSSLQGFPWVKSHIGGLFSLSRERVLADLRICQGVTCSFRMVDTVCIIQNDPQDWQRESARMMICSSANIVIGASNATADEEGFLHPRQTEAVSLDQGIFSVTLSPPGAQRLSTTSDPVKAEPLGTRAWCLQERYLPYRMLPVSKQRVY